MTVAGYSKVKESEVLSNKSWLSLALSLSQWLVSTILALLFGKEARMKAPIASGIVEVCKVLKERSKKNKKYGTVWTPDSSGYKTNTIRYCKQTSLQPACVFSPETSEALRDVLTLINRYRIPFALSSGKHSTSVGHSSTQGGLQIDMSLFCDIQLADDKSYVDIGVGCQWGQVYRHLEGTGVNVLGGRAPTVGVGGFMAGGGGFGWTTSQYGLTANTAIEAELVTPQGQIMTVSRYSDPNLFWALRGGGNRFGIVFRWKLQTHPQSKLIYGGTRTFLYQQVDKVNEAVAEFAKNNKDAKAQLMVAYATLYGIATFISVIVYYDEEDPGNIFDMFSEDLVGKPIKDNWGTRTFTEMVAQDESDKQGGRRCLMDVAMFENFNSKTFLDSTAKEARFWGRQLFRWGCLPKSHAFVSYLVEPFQDQWGVAHKETQGVWSYDQSPMPICIYYAWYLERDDFFFQKAMKQSKEKLLDLARRQGQNVESFTSYPNYAWDQTPLEKIYGEENLQKLQKLRNEYDPENVMSLTGYFL